ncbi:dyp-type peroxidase family protein [Plesiocystis pacifica SIR-1]|uniref:Dyp-type peroxidase family protein n=1 Tax=Plesiocystis pacifica SIR-1 TaxID=391625 RepID=A6GC60_9BACT|nr:Dyp-type peroxidase [Plesiocystis pacifica]EDM76509.1 dyp-type peroxidase family protein [Plesiocystis pacifica SIR-1]
MLELAQVQSNVLRGFRQGEAPKFVQYLFLQFASDRACRALIDALYPLVTSCEAYDQARSGAKQDPAKVGPCPVAVLNIGLSYACLELLGLGGNARALDERDHEATGAIEAFKCGMLERAESILGDRGPSAPEHWESGYRERLHAVISLASGDRGSLDTLRGEVDQRLANTAGVALVFEERGQHFDAPLEGKEHFGYTDGIAQPAVLGSGLESFPGDGTPGKRRGWSPLQPGEFVLGHIDESGQVQFGSQLFKNGSFMVFRKLAQHVARFHEYTAEVGRQRGESAEFVGSKMIGRWPSGAPLVLSPRKDNERLAANPKRNNDFRYTDDKDGTACPFGAHIRRNNPRDDPSGPLTSQTKLHRIIRRATPYGPFLPAGQADDGQDRGILFVVINADISRQFEFVQQNWVDEVLSSTHLTIPEDRDPLIATQTAGAKFLIPSGKRNEAPVIAWKLPTFVTTKGGAYFLLPSIDALYDIAKSIEWDQEGGECESGQPDENGGDGCEKSPAPAPEPSGAPG